MHASDSSSFDRVKSLLGKLDRSIEDARSKRLRGPEEPEETEVEGDQAFFQSDSEHHGEAAANAAEESPARPTSKYGRARPIRDLSGGSNGGAWKTA